MSPFFSIIIPTYNSEKTLSNCLESILSQSFINYEVLIIDGVSTDSTLSIVKSYQDSRLKITSEPDTGIYDAMNKGVKLAKGEWLYFLGSDDLLYSNSILNEIYRILFGSKCKIVYGNVVVIGDAGWAVDKAIYDGKFQLSKLLSKNICHQAIFYQAKILKKVSYNTKYKLCADYDLNLYLWSRYKFQYITNIVAYFHGGNTSSTMNDIDFSKDFSKITIKYFRSILYRPELKPFVLESDLNIIFKSLMRCIYRFSKIL